MNGKPMFLGIGAQRSGTSWLYQNLKVHPEVWLPPLKEIHYFNLLRDGSFLSDHYRQQLGRRFKTNWRSLFRLDWSARDFAWDLNYFSRPRNDAWYQSLFRQGHGRLSGEITPAYSMLEPDRIAEIRQLLPDAMILLFLRDPIDRSWSQARKDLPRRYSMALADIPEDQLLQWFHSDSCLLRSDYVRMLENWWTHFPREQIFIGFFDEIRKNPETLLLSIHRFLGIEESREYIRPAVSRVVNPSPSQGIPVNCEKELARIHGPKLARLSEMIPGVPASWLERAIALTK